MTTSLPVRTLSFTQRETDPSTVSSGLPERGSMDMTEVALSAATASPALNAPNEATYLAQLKDPLSPATKKRSFLGSRNESWQTSDGQNQSIGMDSFASSTSLDLDVSRDGSCSVQFFEQSYDELMERKRYPSRENIDGSSKGPYDQLLSMSAELDDTDLPEQHDIPATLKPVHLASIQLHEDDDGPIVSERRPAPHLERNRKDKPDLKLDRKSPFIKSAPEMTIPARASRIPINEDELMLGIGLDPSMPLDLDRCTPEEIMAIIEKQEQKDRQKTRQKTRPAPGNAVPSRKGSDFELAARFLQPPELEYASTEEIMRIIEAQEKKEKMLAMSSVDDGGQERQAYTTGDLLSDDVASKSILSTNVSGVSDSQKQSKGGEDAILNPVSSPRSRSPGPRSLGFHISPTGQIATLSTEEPKDPRDHARETADEIQLPNLPMEPSPELMEPIGEPAKLKQVPTVQAKVAPPMSEEDLEQPSSTIVEPPVAPIETPVKQRRRQARRARTTVADVDGNPPGGTRADPQEGAGKSDVAVSPKADNSFDDNTPTGRVRSRISSKKKRNSSLRMASWKPVEFSPTSAGTSRAEPDSEQAPKPEPSSTAKGVARKLSKQSSQKKKTRSKKNVLSEAAQDPHKETTEEPSGCAVADIADSEGITPKPEKSAGQDSLEPNVSISDSVDIVDNQQKEAPQDSSDSAPPKASARDRKSREKRSNRKQPALPTEESSEIQTQNQPLSTVSTSSIPHPDIDSLQESTGPTRAASAEVGPTAVSARGTRRGRRGRGRNRTRMTPEDKAQRFNDESAQAEALSRAATTPDGVESQTPNMNRTGGGPDCPILSPDMESPGVVGDDMVGAMAVTVERQEPTQASHVSVASAAPTAPIEAPTPGYRLGNSKTRRKDAEDAKPGAYKVQGRAFGDVPYWIRDAEARREQQRAGGGIMRRISHSISSGFGRSVRNLGASRQSASGGSSTSSALGGGGSSRTVEHVAEGVLAPTPRSPTSNNPILEATVEVSGPAVPQESTADQGKRGSKKIRPSPIHRIRKILNGKSKEAEESNGKDKAASKGGGRFPGLGRSRKKGRKSEEEE